MDTSFTPAELRKLLHESAEAISMSADLTTFNEALADLLFYLMNVMSTVSANTTTPSTRTTSCFTGMDSIIGLDPVQRTRLWNGIKTAISKEK